ncbi:hypothetical protein GGTG_01057 [Gaeumannomyces tritici R3-111a-1]|uniref:Heterokaryon incompatibility domain-containing protein n=1 Tax=Gaeumannomyces tritici (strain R3-111a-1) TaxID=644352 RepID=J3NIH7_GAET3|nr:hypothetical protein GGTG_01057 [Gaeumannomyces tritici R3-111a-1]EJT81070.1 hypothetical protein GGTG_01057 [Gaeumannomyces tritici R3-111a-1]
MIQNLTISISRRPTGSLPSDPALSRVLIARHSLFSFPQAIHRGVECNIPPAPLAEMSTEKAKDQRLCSVCLQLDLSSGKFRVTPESIPSAQSNGWAPGPSSTPPASTIGNPEQDIRSPLGLSPGHSSKQFSTLAEIDSRKDECCLCDILWKAIAGDRPIESPSREATLNLSWEIDGRSRSDSGQVVNRSRRIRLSWRQESEEAQEGRQEKSVFLVCVAPRTAGPAEARFFGRPRLPDDEKLALISSWIDTCANTHGQGGCGAKETRYDTEEEFRRLVKGSYFGVIDVEEMQLKPLPMIRKKPAPYVALSYVWGQGHSAPYTSTRSNVMVHIQKLGLKSAWPKLPQTIQDAILLVWRLGKRYLWIDSLCIVQDSLSSWELNAKSMHLVYGHAHFTICAADGDDATTGLRAVSHAIRTGGRPPWLAGDIRHLPFSPGDPQHTTQGPETATTKSVRFAEDFQASASEIPLIAPYSPGLGLLAFRGPESVIQGSTWSSRGWTYQERLLSTRCLIFAEGKVYFQCRRSLQTQDIFNDTNTSNGQSKKSKRESRQKHRRGSRKERRKDEGDIKSESNIEADSNNGQRANQHTTAHGPHEGYAGDDDGWSLNSADSPLKTLGELRRRAFWVYMKCVEQYTGRTLTKPKDVLAAFQGTSWLLHKHMRAPLLHGLPTSHFDLALLWMPLSALQRRKPRRCPRRFKLRTRAGQSTSSIIPCSQDSLGNCTCRLEQEGFGSNEFPSWSWAGWMGGKADYSLDMIGGTLQNVQEWLRDHTWIFWYIRDEEGNLLPLWDSSHCGEDTSHEERWRGYKGRAVNLQDAPDPRSRSKHSGNIRMVSNKHYLKGIIPEYYNVQDEYYDDFSDEDADSSDEPKTRRRTSHRSDRTVYGRHHHRRVPKAHGQFSRRTTHRISSSSSSNSGSGSGSSRSSSESNSDGIEEIVIKRR